MAYNGYLIKAIKISNEQADYILPMNYIVEKTYDMTYSVMDYDSTRNASGKLVRNAQKHRVPHVAISIKPLWDTDLNSLFSNLQARYIPDKEKEKKIQLSVFIPEINGYVEEYFYIPDTNPKIRRIHTNNKIKYESFTLEFIGY